MASLIFLKSVGFKEFEKAYKYQPYEMCSFSESQTEKFIEKGKIEEHRKFNQFHLSRIYPKGTRFDSSNYDPTPNWFCGSQIVALNYQTCSTPMKINRGRFRENGRCGYILKPEFKPEMNFPYNQLVVTVYGARQLPRTGETSDPYVSVSMHGSKNDQKFETKVVDNNGFNPDWNETFKFDLSQVEYSIILFDIRDKDQIRYKNMGHYALPVYCIKPGFRVIQLEDHLDNKIYNGEIGRASCRERV